jgi:RND family efflux transporter MFP subunit
MRERTQLFITLLIVLSPCGCAKPTEEPQPIIRPVKIVTMGVPDSSAIRAYPGTVKALQEAHQGFEVAGRIIEFLVQEGDQVEEGQVLARLDPRDFENQRRVALANHGVAKADLERSLNIRRLNPDAIAVADIERDRRSVEVTAAQLAIAEKAVEDTELRAAFDGLVARKVVADFANVQAKEPVLILQDISKLKIEISVPERDVVHQQLAERSKQELTDAADPVVVVSALPDRKFAARVKEFATTAEPVTRTFPITLMFDRPDDANILPGMTARVELVIDPELAWSIPVSAVQADASGQSYVWKVDGDSMTVKRTPVELEQLTGVRVRLTAGVSEGEKVAISGVTQLRDGMKVRQYESRP